MPLDRVYSLPISLIALLALSPLANATCYVAAYGLVGEQDGWTACPGTANTAGGIETCCMPGSECGEDSLCRVPDSDNPGNNAWYQAGCTDSNYADSVCRNSCVNYTQTYVQYQDDSQSWMCCGDGGCNGTVTDTTFSAVAPDDWKEITGSSSSSSSSATATATSTAASSSAASTTETPKKQQGPSSADFKPTPTASTGSDEASEGSSSSKDQPVGLSTGAKAGLGVGITLAALALIAALVAIYMLRKRQKQVREMHAADEKMAVGLSPPPPDTPRTEVSGESRYSELPMKPASVYELAGDQRSYFGRK